MAEFGAYTGHDSVGRLMDMQQDKKKKVTLAPPSAASRLEERSSPIATLATDRVTLLDHEGVEHGDSDAHGGRDEDECHAVEFK